MLVWSGLLPACVRPRAEGGERDGIGENWPISYADLEPYYTRVERFLRVCGSSEGLLSVPDGAFLEPLPLSDGELAFRRAVEERWPMRRVIPARVASASPEAALLAATRTRRLSLYADSVVARVLLSRAARGPGGSPTSSARVAAKRSSRPRRSSSAPRRSNRPVYCSTRRPTSTPKGLGNSSGLLGRYLMDHAVGIGIAGRAAPAPPRSRDRR